MAPRRRTHPVLLASVALLVASLFAVATPASAQDSTEPTAAVTTTPVSSETTGEAGDAPVAGVTTEGTLTQTTQGSDERIVTESRKVLAIILALVAVAICLTLLTIRYWRNTKPVAPAVAAGDRDVDGSADVDGAKTKRSRRASGRRSRRSVAGADHSGADTDWEPRGTGEHVAIGASSNSGSRPGRDARRRALGITSDD